LTATPAKKPAPKKAAAEPAQGGGKSGMRRLKPGEILFNDGEKANSLFIIQNGQLRLFKPKGKGFVEIAVLRSGEVIGEMAYFDDDGGGKRSCSASAMVSSEVIEISFTAFAKTMSGLNPWFKTIINTLAKRLRATNARVKELESNSASVNYGTGKHSGYEFFKANDIIKILGTLFLVYKSHGEENPAGVAVHRKTMDLYSKEIYGIIESKMDAMLFILEEMGMIETQQDKDGLPKIIVMKALDQIRSLFIFYNTEKHLTDDKKLRISPKCETFLQKIWAKLKSNPNTDAAMSLVKVDDLLAFWKERNLGITLESLDDAREHGIVGEVIVGDGNELSVEVNYVKLQKLLPTIVFMNKILESNREKSTMA
jgi:CRP/FNR family cyclic AMP-dependent transcriptional regulator